MSRIDWCKAHWWSWIGRLRLKASGVVLGTDVRLYGTPIVVRHPGSNLKIGDRVVLCSHSCFTALGVNHAVVLRTLTPQAELLIGDDVGISGGSICAAMRVVIGSETMLGANVMIADTDFHPLESGGRRFSPQCQAAGCAEVVLGRNVFVGANVTILKGVHIGDDTVIGAGSVVTHDISPGVIAAGVPCRVLRPLPGCTPGSGIEDDKRPQRCTGDSGTAA